MYNIIKDSSRDSKRSLATSRRRRYDKRCRAKGFEPLNWSNPVIRCVLAAGIVAALSVNSFA
jgi:hypothetical protein